MVIAHIRKFPYWYSSLALHALAIALLTYFFVDLFSQEGRYVRTVVQEQKVAVSIRQTSHLKMQKDVEEIAKIKELLEQSLRASNELPVERPGAGEDSVVIKSPTELLAEAKSLSAAIENMKNSQKAKALAELLDISEQEALEKIKSDKALPVDNSDPQNKSEMELAAVVEHLQQQANDALIERDQQLAQQQNGVSLNGSANPLGNAKSNGNGNGNGTGDSGVGPNAMHAENSRQRIASFLYGDMPAPPTDAAGAGNLIFNEGSGSIPSLGNIRLHKGDGLVLGAGGEFSNRFYLNRWYIIGPFDGRRSQGLSTRIYPPEEAVNLAGVYAGKDNRLLSWQYIIADSYPLVPPDFEEGAVYYGYTELLLDKESDLWVWIGADDDARIWLNDRVVFAGGNLDKDWYFQAVYSGNKTNKAHWNFTEEKHLMHFKKGRNKIMFKLFNASRNGFFSMVLSK